MFTRLPIRLRALYQSSLTHPIPKALTAKPMILHPHSLSHREKETAMAPTIRVAALCGSLRKGSYNRGLIRAGSRSHSLLLCVFAFSFLF